MRLRIRTLSKWVTAIGAAFFIGAAPALSEGPYYLRIPKLHLNYPINYKSQNIGPFVWYQDSDTIAIAGHRVTPMAPFGSYGPFRYIDQLDTGDPIYINKRRFVVVKHLVLRPDALWTLNFKGLVLSACTPPHYATYRYVVLARPE